MMLTVIIVGIISFGEIREVFSRSLPPNVGVLPIYEYRDMGYQTITRSPDRVYNNVLSLIDNPELLDIRIDEYNMKRVETVHLAPPPNTIRDEIEQSYVLVKTKTTKRHRGKRYIQPRKYHMLCHFKICNMGRKKTHFVANYHKKK